MGYKEIKQMLVLSSVKFLKFSSSISYKYFDTFITISFIRQYRLPMCF